MAWVLQAFGEGGSKGEGSRECVPFLSRGMPIAQPGVRAQGQQCQQLGVPWCCTQATWY